MTTSMTTSETTSQTTSETTWSAEAVLKQVEGLSCDSRRVQAGWLFAALKGEAADGAAYIEQALAQGARAILLETGGVDKPSELSAETLWLECRNPRKHYAELAAAWWQKMPDTLVGVTGTNGKTSSVFFLQQLWSAAGANSASLGTLGVGRNDALPNDTLPNDTLPLEHGGGGELTTAEPMALHALLARLAAEGVSHAALEASSHGLAQHRLDGVRFKACVLTGLSRDHLDYHKSWEAYRTAKARLFHELLEQGGWMIVPKDDPFARQLVQDMEQKATDKAKIMRTHVADKEEDEKWNDTLQAFDVARKHGRTRFSLRLRCKNFCGDREIVLEELEVAFEESFQLHNLLGALAAFFVTDKGGAWNKTWLKKTLRELRCARGRMERFLHPHLADKGGTASVYVDYAHTPQALEEVLREGQRLAARQGGKLVCVFGCGGERDRAKRALMGAIAGELADRIVVTDDNPRGENAASIRKAIVQPLRDKGIAYEEIGDRRAAIERAIALIEAGDIVIVAGKGHERGQLVGSRLVPFDDAAVVRELLQGVSETS